MNRGLYISATSMVANQRKLDALSNNLANVNTTGYKKDIALNETFPEKLLTKINGKPPRMRLPRENEITYENQGNVHLARADRGYFRVETPRGESYVKDIRFTIDDEGYLKTNYRDGREDLKTDNENYILDRNGNRIQGQAGDLQGVLQGAVYTPPSHIIGTMNAGVNFQKMVVDFTPGNMAETGGTYDLALDGPGFFKITGEDGETYYTRDGSFTINAEGNLTTLSGEIVQGPGNIQGDHVTIDRNGMVIVDGNQVGQLDIVDLENREFLRKVGDNLYRMVEGEDGQPIPPQEIPFEGEVLQGYLEGSNVNSIQEMVEMISLFRDYELGQKSVRTQDEMLEKSSNEIGRV